MEVSTALPYIIHECYIHYLCRYESPSFTARSGKPECGSDERLKELAAGKRMFRSFKMSKIMSYVEWRQDRRNTTR